MFDELQHGYKLAILTELGPNAAARVIWTKSTIPTIQNVEEVIELMSGARPDALRVVRLRSSLSSPLDGLHGNWEATLGNLAYRVQPTLEAKSKAFNEVMAPLGSAPATRLKAWRNWRTVVT